LRLETLPERPPGPGEVRLRVAAIGLNRAEALFRRGAYTQQPELPSRIGYDAAGVIEAVGPGVDDRQLGQRVTTIPAFSMSRHGVYGDSAVVPAQALAPWPVSLGAAEAASLWTPWLTVWGGLVRQGELRRGDFVLVTAAASSVGLAAIQTIVAAGATPIATTRRRAKREALVRAGAPDVIVTEEEDLPARVHEITAGHGADILFDAVAGPSLDTAARAMAIGGRIVIYGYLGGMETALPLVPMLRKALTVRAHSIFHTTGNPAVLQAAIDDITAGVEKGSFQPMVDRIFPLTEIVAAHRYLEASDQVGKIVVVPDSAAVG
jgi:NADPH:quinone reductase-like Zn-dependent oxidoreductase